MSVVELLTVLLAVPCNAKETWPAVCGADEQQEFNADLSNRVYK